MFHFTRAHVSFKSNYLLPIARSFFARKMHSKIQKFQPTASISIVQVPMFEDNYTYLIHNSESSWTAAVDPADPQVAVKAMMEHLNVESLNAVLTTHHHWFPHEFSIFLLAG